MAAIPRMLTLDPGHAAAYIQLSALSALYPSEKGAFAMIGLINGALTPVADGVRLKFALARRLYEYPLKSPPSAPRQYPEAAPPTLRGHSWPLEKL